MFQDGGHISSCRDARHQLCNGAGVAPAHGAAPRLPLPPHRRGAHHALPRPEGRRRPVRGFRRRRGRPQQVRALGPAIAGEDGGEGVVLLLPQGPQVPDGAEDEQGHGGRVLEGHGQGQGHLQGQGARRLQEDARLLHGEGAQGREVWVGHARVPPPRQAPRRQGRIRIQERVGAVQGVQEEPCRRRRRTGGRPKGRHGGVHQDGRRHRRSHLPPPSPADGRVRLRRRRQPGPGGGGGSRDLLLQRTGGPVLQPDAAAAAAGRRRPRHGGPPRPRLLAVPLQLRALIVRAAAPRREPHAAPRVRRRPPGHVRAAAGAGGVQQAGGRAGAAERVAGHGAHLRDLLLLRPTVRRPGPALGLLITSPALMAISIAR
ncbi:hypothetical protein U9M48_032806 [Paspalum notatum var. saurae]|uniref:Uncharacterized protein n=1 Tax=Paspalum notatum var. saurae TaxID=547442 RepID=A0AAQ3U5Y0_PASNO